MVELDVGRLLRGEVAADPRIRLTADSVLTGTSTPVDEAALALLGDRELSSWVDAGELAARHGAPAQAVDELTRQGLLVSDAEDDHLRELRRRDELLSASGWEPRAALYHFLNRWSDVDLDQPLPSNEDEAREIGAARRLQTERFLEAAGPPPPHFHSVANVGVHPLPLADGPEDGIVRTLRQRRTSRVFDREAPLRLDELSRLLATVFGCHGFARVSPSVVNLKKTSPSGGSLHPIEAYPLVIRCRNLEPGLFHYRVEDHALERLESLGEADAEALAEELAAGQGFTRGAAVLFLMTARFGRTFWKYPNHPRAYTVVNMDAAHLSQTLYVACAAQGLGAFFTAAVNGANVERRLGVDPYAEGAIAIAGCGKPRRDPFGLEPVFEPFVPRRTRI